MKRTATCLWAMLFGVIVILSGWSIAIAAPKTIELSLAQTIPPQIPFGKLTQQWADMVAERTNNKVKINIYWGEIPAQGLGVLPRCSDRP